MAKQLNVNLAINADAKQAQAELKKLQQDLHGIMNAGMGKNLSSGMKEASAAAKELSYHLNQAYNTSTGNLDLSKLNASLQKSSTNVTQLSNKLLQAGASGQSAFINLAQAISKADYPMFKLNSRLTEMWTTLKNTARWQLSSSMLHGFMGAVQKATSYARDLDESLNNIRIVTGQSADKMDEFAAKANRAAKALSTTTTAYTNAALIFYQQGLDDSAVEERTNITIKMAQAAGENATEVSSYLTAIWNNFNSEIESGSRSLESFGDSMARLGAETAASSAEIAAGLEKFASIGETIGLSFDYASAAVTTIVDKTRQSADTVGTALKTIFARLQGLQLGETLEDGVDLNKYSDALEKVGVNVLDLNGNLRAADDIIYDLGLKWNTLSRAQQTALAQTVAGTRQYAQLMSLMNNFDDFLENVDISKNAEGTLTEQAEIFADSWEGAKKRVQAAAEGIYDSLINKDLMKGYNNVLADILTSVENLIDGMGGLGGVISAVGTFALSFISHKIQPAIQGLILNVQNLFTSTQAQARQLVSGVQTKSVEQINSGKYDPEQVQQLRNANVLTEARARLTVASKQLTQQESQLYQQDIQLMEMAAQKAELIAKNVTLLQNQASQMIEDVNVTEASSEANRVYNEMLKERIALKEADYDRAMSAEGTSDDFDTYIQSEQSLDRLIATKERLDLTTNDLIGSIMQEMQACKGSESAMAALGDDVSTLANKSLDVSGKFAQFVDSLRIPKGATDSVESYKNSVELLYKSLPKVIRQSTEVQRALKKIYDAKDSKNFNTALNQMQKAMKGVKIGGQDLNKIVKELNPKSYKEFEEILKRLSKEEANLVKAQQELNNALVGFNPQHFVTGTERIVAMASAMGQVAMMGQSITSMISAWDNEDLTFGEKLTTTFMSISMLIPGVISSFNSLKTMISGTALATALHDAALKKMGLTQDEITAKQVLYNAAKKGEIATDAAQAASKTLLTGLLRTEKKTIDENTASLIQNKIAEEMANGASLEAAIITALSTKLTGLDAAVTDKATAAKIAHKIAADALGTSLKAMLGPIGWVIAALTALVTILTLVAKKQEEAAKAAKENRLAEAEASQKAAEETKKLNDANMELYKTYNNLRIRNDESTTAKEQLKTATDELCKALGVEWDALDRLQGKYEDVNAAILEKRKEQVQETIDAYNQAIADNKDIVEDKVDEAIEEYDFGHSTGQYVDGTKYDRIYAQPESGMSAGGWGDSADELVGNIFTSYLQDNYGDRFHSIDKRQLEFNEDVDEAEALNILMDTFRYMRDNAEDLGITEDVKDDSEFYQWFRQLYNNSDVSELLSQIAADEVAREEAIAQMAEINAELAQAQVETGMSIGEITDIEDYEAYKNQYVTELRNLLKTSGADMNKYTDDVLNDMADNYLSTYTSIAGIIENANIKDAIKERLMATGKDSEEDIDAFLDKAEKDGTLSFVAQVTTDFSTIDSLQQSMDYIQAQADKHAVEVASGALKKDGMTLDDWSTIKNSGIDWGNEEKDIIDYNSFLLMSYEEQVAYLQGLEEKYSQALKDSIDTVIDVNTKSVDKELIPALQVAMAAVSGFEEKMKGMGNIGLFLMSQIKHLDPAAEGYQDELKRILGTQQGNIARIHFGLTEEDITSYLKAKNNVVSLQTSTDELVDTTNKLSEQQTIDALFDFKTAKEDVQDLVKELSGLGEGDTIDAEQYKILSEYLPQLKNQFIETTDGTYKLASGLDGVQLSWRDLNAITYENGGKLLSGEDIANTITSLDELQAAVVGGAITLEESRSRIKDIVESNLEAAASLDELRQAAVEGASYGGLDYNAYAENLIRLGEEYDNCTTELEEYQQALLSGDSAQIQVAESALELSIQIGELASQFNLDAKETENYAKRLAESLKIDEQTAVKLAVANQRVDRGLTNLNENLEDYSKALKNNAKNSAKWSETMSAIKTDLADILNVADGEMLSDQFAEQVWASEDLKKALDGDVEAIERLKALAADDIIINVVANQSEDPENIKARWQQLKDDFAAMGDIDAPGVDHSKLLAAFNEMIVAGNMTKDQIEAALAGLHVSANVKTTYVPQRVTVPQTITEEAMVNSGWEEVMVPGPDGEWVPQPVMMKKKITRTYDAGTVEVDGVVPQYEIEGTEGPGGITTAFSSAPTITPSFDATTTGIQENSGSKKSTKPTVGQKERYHTVNKKIDSANRKKDRAAADKDQAFGKSKLKYIDDEIKAIEDLQEAYKNYYDEIANPQTGYLAKDLQALNDFVNNNQGAIKPIIDQDGIISNWDQILDKEKQLYEEVMNGDNFDEAAKEAAEKRWDDINDLIQQYEDTIEEFEKVKDEQAALERERISKELERITVEVDFEIEINQRDLDKLDYIVEELNRGLHNAIEVIDALGQSVSRYENQSTAMRDGIDRIRANAAAEGRELTDDEQRQIWDYEDQLLDINRSLYDLMDTVDKQVLEEFQEFNDAIDENIARFDTYNEALDYYASIITLSGRATKDSALLMSIATQKVDTSMTKLNSSYDKYLANVAAQQDALAHLNAATTEEDREYWQKQYDEITKAVETSHNEVLASWEQVLQDASDKFDLAVQQTLETLKSSISEYGLDGLADRYEKATEEQERYLSNLDKEYELNKLSREIAKSIDETDNVHAKQELNKLLDEINKKQASGVKMSKYDLEIMQKQYDVEMAKLALEEARNAKSTVRLRKDNEGNFGYVYTADQDKVADAQQKYEDTLYALQKTSEDYVKEMSDMIIQNEQDMINALENIDKTRFNTKEEYEAEVARITKYYLDKDLYLRQELDKAVVASGTTYGKTVLGQIEKASTWEEAHDNLKTNTNAAQQSMCDAWVAWKDTTTLAMETVGTNADGFTTTITTDLQAIGTATTTLASDIDTQTQNMEDHIQGVMDKVAEFRRQYIEAIQAMIDKNKEWVGIQGTTLTAPATTTPPVTETPPEETPQEQAPEVKTEPVVEQPKKMPHSDMVDLVVDMGQGDYGNGSARRKAVEAKYPGICSTAQGILNQAIREDSWNYHHNGNKWKSQTVDRLVTAAGYDTGGYTGVWGPEGKLAFLHEKELVLNKNDTSNLLSSVDLLHNIISQIDLMAASHSIFSGLMSPSYGGGQGVLEQDVHIEAHFPNATNHSEIEEAFGNLINLASQYANRK